MRKEEGQRRHSTLDVCDTLAVEQHSIENRHDSLVEITAWTQEHF